MTPDELREAITRDQTRCRCGHLLAACADCRDWLIEHSARIAAGWRWYVNTRPSLARVHMADAAEADNDAWYEGGR
jgi:hypothetical protein